MRLMYTTALASAVMFAGPALAAGDKVEGTTGMTSPEASAAQLPGHGADTTILRQNFAGAGFTDWQAADDAQIFRMQTGDGQPVWVVLMPDGFQVGAAEPGAMEQETGDLAEAPGSGLDRQDLPELSEQAEAGDMSQRGEQADVSETFESAEQPDIAEAPELGEPGEQPAIAEAPGLGEQGFVGETEPEGFAAQIPGELRSDLEGAGFQQIESIDGAGIFHARTEDGQMAFVIVGELSGAGVGFDGRQPMDMDQPAPGATPDLPQPAPGTGQSPGLPQ